MLEQAAGVEDEFTSARAKKAACRGTALARGGVRDAELVEKAGVG